MASSPSSTRPESSRLGGLGWNFVTASLPVIGSFLVSIFLAPHLGPGLWGRYSLVMTATTLWLIVAKFGIHAATGRLIAENPGDEGRWIRAGLGLRLGATLPIALVSLITALPLAHSFQVTDSASVFLWIAPVLIAASLFEFATEVLVGLSAFRSLLLARASFLILRLGAVTLVVAGGHGIASFLFGHATAQLFPATLVLIWVVRRYAWSGDTLKPALRRTWELSVPLAFGSASFLIFSHTDRLMLGWFWDEATVGQFSVARNVLDAAIFPMTALAWSLRPSLVRAATHTHDFRQKLRRGLGWAAIFSIAAPLVLWQVAPRLLVQDWLYGSQYAIAADLLVWMTPILLLRGMGVVIFPALLALDEQSHYARLMIATALVNVVANLVAIPRLGAEGAILGTIVALTFLTVGGFAHIARRGGFSLTQS